MRFRNSGYSSLFFYFLKKWIGFISVEINNPSNKDRQSVCLGKTQPGYLMDTCLSGQDHDKALLAKFDIKG
jgi:hypothetical protein